MDILIKYIKYLENILYNQKDRKKVIFEFSNEILLNDDTVYNDEVDNMLSDLAHDLAYYEPNSEYREQESSLFGDEELLGKIKPLIEKLKKIIDSK